MGDEVRLAGALVVGVLITGLATPSIRRLAIRTNFYDHPAGYKQHAGPTPYLGGAAVMAGFLVAAILFGRALTDFGTAILCASGLFLIGTIDDRVGLGIGVRLLGQVAAALTLWLAGATWGIGSDAADLAVTLFWIIGVTNAFNLMDNIDGASAAVGAAAALGIGVLAASEGGIAVAALSFGLAGACAGFLPHNLARPSRIFLGDGGSTPIGFLLAAAVMACPHEPSGWTALLASAPLVGLVIFDTTLVVVSRFRRGARVFSGGRDHLTHRLLGLLRSERSVALVLATAQGSLGLVAIALDGMDEQWIAAIAAGYLVGGAIAIAALEGFPLGRIAQERPT
jgi:UDP-GlcNAc:undecaprenyl-phosphate GlcNAc-1-phosphate transferase